MNDSTNMQTLLSINYGLSAFIYSLRCRWDKRLPRWQRRGKGKREKRHRQEFHSGDESCNISLPPPKNDHTLKTINAIQITYHNDHEGKLLRTLISLPIFTTCLYQGMTFPLEKQIHHSSLKIKPGHQWGLILVHESVRATSTDINKTGRGSGNITIWAVKSAAHMLQ